MSIFEVPDILFNELLLISIGYSIFIQYIWLQNTSVKSVTLMVLNTLMYHIHNFSSFLSAKLSVTEALLLYERYEFEKST